MSRALGDVVGHKEAGIVETCDYSVHKTKDMHAFVLCSDGVWEFIDANGCAMILLGNKDPVTGKIDPVSAADDLAKVRVWLQTIISRR